MMVVTGASGMLGRTIVQQARGIGCEVAGLRHSREMNLPGVLEFNVNLTDQAAVNKIILELHPSTVIHCAALTDVDFCEDHPELAYEVNVLASAVIARAASEIGAHFMYISTDSVFDGQTGNYSEGSVPAPLNVYARTKLLGEQEALRLGANPLLLRVNFYGRVNQHRKGLADWILQQLNAGKRVPGFADVYFCPILVSDVADFILALHRKSASGTFNLVGSERVSKFEFARRLAEMFGFDPDQVAAVQLSDAKLRAPRPRDTSLNTAKISRELGCAMPGLEAGLRKLRNIYETECEGTLRN